MSTRQPLPRLPYVLLAAMTVVSFVGPFVLLGTLQGGQSGKWPPDRPVEWVAVYAVFGLASLLFLACVSLGWWYRRATPVPEPKLQIRAHEHSIAQESENLDVMDK